MSGPDIIVLTQRIAAGRSNWYKDLIRTWPKPIATELRPLTGTFHHPSFGTWVFDESSNLTVMPRGTDDNTPWLDHLYGDSRQVVVHVGGGKYKGALEWTPGEGQDKHWDKLYGFSFDLEETAEGIGVSGLDAFSAEDYAAPPAVFRRV